MRILLYVLLSCKGWHLYKACLICCKVQAHASPLVCLRLVMCVSGGGFGSKRLRGFRRDTLERDGHPFGRDCTARLMLRTNRFDGVARK